MVEAARVVYCIVILVTVAIYSFYALRGIGSILGGHLKESIQSEFNTNPHMLKDYMQYKEQLRIQEEHEQARKKEQEAREQEVKELEEQARRIREKLEAMREPRGKYVEVAGVREIRDDGEVVEGYEGYHNPTHDGEL